MSKQQFDPNNPNQNGVKLVCYNSGGQWWLDYQDEVGLINEGWLINISPSLYTKRRIDGAFLPNATLQEAKQSFEWATQYKAGVRMCMCCGDTFAFIEHKHNPLTRVELPDRSPYIWDDTFVENNYGDSYDDWQLD